MKRFATIETMYEESVATYTELFTNLKARGLEKVWLVVSNAHKGHMNRLHNLWES